MTSLIDPRIYPLGQIGTTVAAPEEENEIRDWHEMAGQSLSSASRGESEVLDGQLEGRIARAFADGRVSMVHDALQRAATPSMYRHLWRAVIAAWRGSVAAAQASVVAHGFVIPVVVVAAADRDIELAMVLGEPQAIVDSMQEHDALAGNRNFGIGSALAGIVHVGLDAAAKWPRPDELLDAGTWVDQVPASPVRIVAGREGAHLRFLLGSALASPRSTLFEARDAGKWGIPVAQRLSRQLAASDSQVLALPGAPGDILSAWQQGLVAHREVALQLFAGSALRNQRASFGEPGVVVSAHRTDPGELRISLSSPFGERDAEGFRCPLYPFERIEDVLKMITDLFDACRVADLRVLPGIHPDREPETGLPLFYRADALPRE